MAALVRSIAGPAGVATAVSAPAAAGIIIHARKDLRGIVLAVKKERD